MIGLEGIGDDVLTANHCSFLSGKNIHSFDSIEIPIRKQKQDRRMIRVGNDLWVGAHAVVMESVGDECVVGAGSFVTKRAEPYGVVACNPMR